MLWFYLVCAPETCRRRDNSQAAILFLRSVKKIVNFQIDGQSSIAYMINWLHSWSTGREFKSLEIKFAGLCNGPLSLSIKFIWRVYLFNLGSNPSLLLMASDHRFSRIWRRWKIESKDWSFQSSVQNLYLQMPMQGSNALNKSCKQRYLR